MNYRKLANIKVSAIGMGCMGFSHGYGQPPEHNESLRLIRYAHDLGCTHFDTAEGYGAGHNEELVGQALKPVRQKVVLATKFYIADSSPENTAEKQIRAHLAESLRRLGTDYIDLYYQHRITPQIPVEEIALVMGKLITEGKILGWGQSQANVDQIRRAHTVTPMSAIQSEYSMMERMFENDVIPTCRELNIGFVPFSPLGSGFLTGTIRQGTKYEGDDVRRVITRFEENSIRANQPIIELLNSFATAKNATPAQISLAWIAGKGDFISPIPGSRKHERIRENIGAAEVILTNDEVARLDHALSEIPVRGNRTDEDIARLRVV